jgi:hypothetical protein
MTSSGDYVKKEDENEKFNFQEYLLELALNQNENHKLKSRFNFISNLFKNRWLRNEKERV